MRRAAADHALSVLPSLVQIMQQQDERYHARVDTSATGGTVYVASNPAHRFEARFDDRGVAVHLSDQLALRMRVASVRLDDHHTPLGHTPWSIRDGRIEHANAIGGLQITEWYQNAAVGLEQGFTIDTRAKAGGATATLPASLALAIGVGRDWTPRLDAKGSGIRLEGPGGATLQYGGLSAWDATERSLPARLSADGETITVHVETAGAQYPITIDPFVQQTQILKPDGQNEETFSFGLDLDGNTAIIAAPVEFVEDPPSIGAGYVFTRSGSTWTLQARLTAELAGGLGWDVALEGDTAVLGAPFSGAVEGGQAFVFTRSGSTWTQQAALEAADGASSDFFGVSVALSGNTAIVGAFAADPGSNIQQAPPTCSSGADRRGRSKPSSSPATGSLSTTSGGASRSPAIPRWSERQPM
jgi:hypothetical protein